MLGHMGDIGIEANFVGFKRNRLKADELAAVKQVDFGGVVAAGECIGQVDAGFEQALTKITDFAKR